VPALPNIQAAEVYPTENVVATDYHAEIRDEEILSKTKHTCSLYVVRIRKHGKRAISGKILLWLKKRRLTVSCLQKQDEKLCRIYTVHCENMLPYTVDINVFSQLLPLWTSLTHSTKCLLQQQPNRLARQTVRMRILNFNVA